MTDEAKALVERLRELERDLKPFEHKTVGSIRIDLDDVRAIIGCPDLIETQAREIERLREALQWMVDNDETNEGDEPMDEFGGQSWNEINAYWIAGLNKARAALGESHDQ